MSMAKTKHDNIIISFLNHKRDKTVIFDSINCIPVHLFLTELIKLKANFSGKICDSSRFCLDENSKVSQESEKATKVKKQYYERKRMNIFTSMLLPGISVLILFYPLPFIILVVLRRSV